MAFFSNLSIRSKVLSAFAVVLITTMGLGLFAINRLSIVNGSAAEIRDNWLPATAWLGTLAEAAERYRALEGVHIMSTSAAAKDREEASLRGVLQAFDKTWALYEATVTTPAERAIVERFKKAWSAYLASGNEAVALSRKNQNEAAAALFLGKVREDFAKVRTALEEDVDFNVAEGRKEADKGAEVYRSGGNWIIGSLVLAAILCAAMGFLLVLSIARPLVRLNEGMSEMANGNLNVAIAGIDRRDEIGNMAKTIGVIRQNAENEAIKKREDTQREEVTRSTQRKAEMQKLANEFETVVGEIVATVSSASTELEASATTLTKTADNTQKLAIVVAAASEEASTNVQSVASATEEMAASVSEIGRQVQESSRISNEAVGQAQTTDERMARLAQSASRIGDVTKLITTIAEQTNLLALNATIEAARAGESGRGFAVVAQEVKALASQTANATSEISTQIAEMQAATQESVTAIKEIGGTIGRISEIATTIASAVEEQGAATQEITRNVQQAAAGTTQVASNITEVNRGAAETGAASSQVLSSAQSLSSESNRLKLEMDKFLASVRAA